MMFFWLNIAAIGSVYSAMFDRVHAAAYRAGELDVSPPVASDFGRRPSRGV
jgi:hypothetical protein